MSALVVLNARGRATLAMATPFVIPLPNPNTVYPNAPCRAYMFELCRRPSHVLNYDYGQLYELRFWTLEIESWVGPDQANCPVELRYIDRMNHWPHIQKGARLYVQSITRGDDGISVVRVLEHKRNQRVHVDADADSRIDMFPPDFVGVAENVTQSFHDWTTRWVPDAATAVAESFRAVDLTPLPNQLCHATIIVGRERGRLDFRPMTMDLPLTRRGNVYWNGTFVATCTRPMMASVVADDVGTGKTLTALAVVAANGPRSLGPPHPRAHVVSESSDVRDAVAARLALRSTDAAPQAWISDPALQGGTLVVAPVSLLSHWRAEIRRALPGASVHVFHGSGRAVSAADLARRDIVLVTPAMLTRAAKMMPTVCRWLRMQRSEYWLDPTHWHERTTMVGGARVGGSGEEVELMLPSFLHDELVRVGDDGHTYVTVPPARVADLSVMLVVRAAPRPRRVFALYEPWLVRVTSYRTQCGFTDGTERGDLACPHCNLPTLRMDWHVQGDDLAHAAAHLGGHSMPFAPLLVAWTRVIVDEIHLFRSHTTLVGAALRALCRHSTIGLTASLDRGRSILELLDHQTMVNDWPLRLARMTLRVPRATVPRADAAPTLHEVRIEDPAVAAASAELIATGMPFRESRMAMTLLGSALRRVLHARASGGLIAAPTAAAVRARLEAIPRGAGAGVSSTSAPGDMVAVASVAGTGLVCPVCLMDAETDGDDAASVQWLVLRPCMHALCSECANAMRSVTHCPMCRTVVSGIARVETAQGAAMDEETPADPDPPAEVGATSPKMQRLLETVQAIRAVGERAVAFVEGSSDVLRRVAATLRAAGVQAAVLTGSQSVASRTRALAALDDGSVEVLVATYRTGSVGLNATAANHVILVDMPPRVDFVHQAIGRANRLGQTRPVHVHALLYKDTVEERAWTAWMQRGATTSMTDLTSDECFRQ